METSKEIQEMLAKLQAENAKLKADIAKAGVKPAGNGLKVTDKGGVSCYGLGRFPVTLYRSQWVKLLSKAKEIEAFLEENKDKLANKDAA